jgi:hypothetical protein
VFTVAEKILRQGYIIGLHSPEPFDIINNLETDAADTARSNTKGLPKDIMGKKLNKEMAVSFGRRLIGLKWKDKGDVFMLSSIHDEETRTVHGKKGGEKQKPKM